ncbi:MAG: SDR family NAD(P)-dependent oxidoreductase [Desulfobacteraceae bacterium]|nr:SDR family NAD(P)-dependent oxidoreductase [Desulfobacteraceae bacterium]MBC2749484.1 SDR family NAD(P)-dependent oxidoreductase [Desulfobacteraceae bacterium]
MTDRPVVLVTGASRGIGAAAARRLLARGCQVTIVARSRKGIASFAAETAGTQRLLPLSGDVAREPDCCQLVADTVARFGRLDALINNAGILGPVARLADADPGEWQYNLAVNLIGPFYLARAAIPHLRSTHGRIVNVSSGAAVKAIEGWSAYCVAKAGVTHLTRLLAAEEPDITTVALRPGVVDTAMQTMIRAEGPDVMTPAKTAHFRQLKEENKLLDPAIPAGKIAWLALDAPPALSGMFLDYDDPRIGDEIEAS